MLLLGTGTFKYHFIFIIIILFKIKFSFVKKSLIKFMKDILIQRVIHKATFCLTVFEIL